MGFSTVLKLNLRQNKKAIIKKSSTTPENHGSNPESWQNLYVVVTVF